MVLLLTRVVGIGVETADMLVLVRAQPRANGRQTRHHHVSV
jgi:hypothetical protein